jgi:hypothetical protein
MSLFATHRAEGPDDAMVIMDKSVFFLDIRHEDGDGECLSSITMGV